MKSDRENLQFRLTRDVLRDAPKERLTQNTDLEKTGRYVPVQDRDGSLSPHTGDLVFIADCLAYAEDRALWSKDRNTQLMGCLLDKCARIAARELLNLGDSK